MDEADQCEEDEAVVEEHREVEVASVLVEEVVVVALVDSREVVVVVSLLEDEGALEVAFQEDVVERLSLRWFIVDSRRSRLLCMVYGCQGLPSGFHQKGHGVHILLFRPHYQLICLSDS